MAQISSNEDLDAFIWTTLQGSACAQNYIDFIRHASGRVAPYEEAFLQAERYWRPADHQDATPSVPKFVQVVAEVQAQANAGNPVAILHLAQFFINGVGEPAGEAIGQSWLRRGAVLENADCMILLRQSLRKTDWITARQVLEHDVPLGHTFAHLELAEIDPQRKPSHPEQALQSEDPHAYAL